MGAILFSNLMAESKSFRKKVDKFIWQFTTFGTLRKPTGKFPDADRGSSGRLGHRFSGNERLKPGGPGNPVGVGTRRWLYFSP
jgi:hypothetical protein